LLNLYLILLLISVTLYCFFIHISQSSVITTQDSTNYRFFALFIHKSVHIFIKGNQEKVNPG